MKTKFTLIAILFSVAQVFAQADKETHPKEAKTLVKKFFEHFHKRDTTALREMMMDHTMTSIVSTGKTSVQKSSVDQFLSGLASIPDGRDFREQILDYDVYSDGTMATVTTPYVLYLDGNQMHSGTNIFILGRMDGGWKIVGITDSRIMD